MHYRIQYVELQEEEKSAHTISGPRCAQLPPFLDLFGKYLSQFFPTQSNSFSYSGKGSKKIIFSWILYFSWRVPRFISVAQNMQSSYFVSIRYMVSKILFSRIWYLFGSKAQCTSVLLSYEDVLLYDKLSSILSMAVRSEIIQIGLVF